MKSVVSGSALVVAAVLIAVCCSTVVAADSGSATPNIVRMFKAYSAGDSGHPWHLTHQLLGHQFNGSIVLNVSQMEMGWRLGTLHGADNADREWQYEVTVVAGGDEGGDSEQSIDETLTFSLTKLRFFNRQTETFEEEDPWALKQSLTKGKKKSGQQPQKRKEIASFPMESRSFRFTKVAKISMTSAGSTNDEPAVLFGTTSHTFSDEQLPVQLSSEYTELSPETRFLTLVVGTPQSLLTATTPTEDDGDDEDEESEATNTGRRRGSANSKISAFSPRTIEKDRLEVFHFRGTTVKTDAVWYQSPSFMGVMIAGFFIFRIWSGFSEARNQMASAGKSSKKKNQ